MYTEKAGKYSFEVGIYRPPSEGGSYSLLMRFTRNCPWNKCTFCSMYKTERFSLRTAEEIKADIDSVSSLCREMKTISWRLGHAGEINRDVAIAMIDKEPAFNTSHGFVMIFNWLQSGGKTAFLQDGNSLMMPSDKLIDVLKHLRKSLPSLKRVTTYARSKTLARKSLEELTGIREAGLDRLHVGLETGDDTLLKRTKKGVSGQEHIDGGKKAVAAGFQLSEYWMPGLGGKERWREHAVNTARVLNGIDPHYIRSRPFLPRPGTPIYQEYENGELTLLTPYEQLAELKLMVEELNVTSRVCFDHDGNYWINNQGRRLFSLGYEGYKFPEQKSLVLDLIDQGMEAQKGRTDARRFRVIK